MISHILSLVVGFIIGVFIKKHIIYEFISWVCIPLEFLLAMFLSTEIFLDITIILIELSMGMIAAVLLISRK